MLSTKQFERAILNKCFIMVNFSMTWPVLIQSGNSFQEAYAKTIMCVENLSTWQYRTTALSNCFADSLDPCSRIVQKQTIASNMLHICLGFDYKVLFRICLVKLREGEERKGNERWRDMILSFLRNNC